MLVLSRNVGERIVINEQIVVTVLAVNNKGTRLGIEAPPTVPVDREEVARQRRTAAQAKSRLP